MEIQNLYCLVDITKQHVTLELYKINELSVVPEIDLENQTWKDPLWGLLKIGENSGTSTVRFIFDSTNFEHVKKAFAVAQNFQR